MTTHQSEGGVGSGDNQLGTIIDQVGWSIAGASVFAILSLVGVPILGGEYNVFWLILLPILLGTIAALLVK